MALLLADLTLPLAPGAATLRRVLAGMTLAQAQALLRTAQAHDRGLARLLAQLDDAGVLRALLLRPNVSVLARVWLAVPEKRAELRDRLRAALAVEAALVGKLNEPVTIASGVTFGIPRLGVRGWADTAVPIEAATLAALAAQHESPVYLPLHPALPNARLALADDNPLPIFYDHPKRRGNVVSLGDQPEALWQEQLHFAVDHILHHLPALLDEMRLFLGHVIPVGFLAEDHQSASYPHALGTIYLTLHPRPMMMLEALIHEFQHNKLHALMQLGPVLAGDEDLRVASPVRPDPRPLRGVVLALHAFLPVADLYQRLREADDPLSHEHWFDARFAAIRQSNRAAWLTVQEHAQWTALSQGLGDELARLDAALSEP
jgi:HEXXH motif-containing protein